MDAGVTLGLHTLSAVNIAEVSPFLRDATDAYLRAYIDVAARLNAAWGGSAMRGIISPTTSRCAWKPGWNDLKRATGYAEEKGVQLLLENLNAEPAQAEVNYSRPQC